MKKLSDYKDEEALDLWCDLLDPMTAILGDERIQEGMGNKPPFLIAKDILATHKKEALQIIKRVDPEPLDGMNIIIRTVNVVLEFMNHPDLKDFFASAGQGKTEKESSGDAMESTEEEA